MRVRNYIIRITGTLLLVYLSCFSCFGQHYEKLKADAFEHASQKEYEQSLNLSKEIYSVFPDDLDACVLISFSLINLNRAAEAFPFIKAGLRLDPSSFQMNLDAAYYFAAINEIDQAKSFFSMAMNLRPDDIKTTDIIDEIKSVGINVNEAVRFQELSNWYEQTAGSNQTRYSGLASVYQKISSSDANAVGKVVEEYAEIFKSYQWHHVAIAMYSYGSDYLRTNGYFSEALNMALAGYRYYTSYGCNDNTDQAAFLLLQIVKSYEVLGNHEQIFQFKEEIVQLSPSLYVHTSDVQSLILLSTSANVLGKTNDAQQLAYVAYKIAETNQYKFGMAKSLNAICATFNFLQSKEGAETAVSAGEEALRLCISLKLEELSGAVIGNLALAYFKLGTRDGQARCFRLHGSLAAIHKSKNQLAEAALTLNNAGALFFYSGDYDYAAQLFEESISLAENNSNKLSFEDKLSFYQSQISAYQFLTVCYAKLNNVDKAFEVMEGSRSRVLAERVANGSPVSRATIADVQASLDEHEASVMYSLFSGHEVTILVITKTNASVLFHSDNNFVGGFKEKYLDRLKKEHNERKGIDQDEPYDPDRRVNINDFHKLTQLTRKFFERPGVADDVLKEYMQGYYRFLILPISNRLSNIKKLVISADDVLNYIPFEALQLYDGTYLVEKFDIRYQHSAAMQKILSQRKYTERRKPLLAMGGAKFENISATPLPFNTQRDLNQLRVIVDENEKSGKSQRVPYATIFGTTAMTYLPGTVQEVKNIATVVPGSETYLGENMTENQIKKLSASGTLSQYKILHLATHGFVVNEVPALSGIAMSIFTNEVDGEDGFLNIREIATLRLNADLTILSACQTALGKLYSGEGVTGLTQSLIAAGSNAAMVSLWPVNDNSTMLFMSDFYKESQKGKSYTEVINAIKRKFIRGDYGDQFRHPNFWAPFIYIGNKN